MKEKEIRVLMVAPMEPPKLVMLRNDLDSLQKAVSIGAPEQGLIELVHIEDNVYCLGNEEAKIIGLPANRYLGNDIICGTFYVVGDDEDGNLASLTPEQIEKYSEFFGHIDVISNEEVDSRLVVRFYPL